MLRTVSRVSFLALIPFVFISHNTYAQLTILPGETYDNTTYYSNYDVINNQGTFNNTVDVSNNGLFLNYGLVNSSGTMS